MFLYLMYCRWPVHNYGPEALKDAAVMARAFPSRSAQRQKMLPINYQEPPQEAG